MEKSSGTLYWYGSGGEVLAESNLSGTVNEEYIFFGGARLGRVDRPSGAVHYYFSDHLGSASMITDASGTVQERYFYYPYGGLQSSVGSDTNHYKFTGKERDAESGLDNFGARYHTSSLGRLMTPDPVLNSANPTNPQSWSRYAYAFNSPSRYVDPSGLYNVDCTDDPNCKKDTQAVKDAVSDLQTRITNSTPEEQIALGQSLQAFGTYNDGNNVTVSFGQTGDGSNAVTLPHFDNASQKFDSFHVIFDPKKIRGSSWAIDVAHEGFHVRDYEDARILNKDLTGGLTLFQQEYRAYKWASVAAADALGSSSFTITNKQRNKFLIWNKSWGAVDDKALTSFITSEDNKAGDRKEALPHDPWGAP